MTTTTSTKFWANEDGSIYCEDHAGYTFTCLRKNRPHHTSLNLGDGLGRVYLLTDEEVEDLKKSLEVETLCMTCHFGN